MTRLARKTRIARSCEYRCALLLPDKNPPGIFNTAIVGAAVVVVVVVCPCSSTCSHVKTWRPLDTNHDTWPSKRRYDLRVDHSDAKKEIESKRAIKSRRSLSLRVFIFSFPFLALPPTPLSFLLLLLSICPSIYLPVHLRLTRSLRLPFRWPLGPLHRPSIKVLNSRAYTHTHIHRHAHTHTDVALRCCAHNPAGSFPC